MYVINKHVYSLFTLFDRHTFGADAERFKHSFCVRLDLEAEAPGPGWYSPMVPGELQRRTNDNYPNSDTIESMRRTMSPTFRF